MSAASEKLRLRKELEKLHNVVRGWKRDDLVLGRWFPQLLSRTLGAMAAAPTPPEVRERWPGNEAREDLIDDIVSWTIREAILATDAYDEQLSATEIRNLKEKKPGGEQKLMGDTIPLIAEIIYTAKLDVDLIFNVAAACGKRLTADQTGLFEEAFGRALGAFDYEGARAKGNPLEQIGAKIFDRAIVQTIGSNLSDAQRKGFYCYYAKAVANEAMKLVEKLPTWEAPPKEEGAATGGMVAASEDDLPAY